MARKGLASLLAGLILIGALSGCGRTEPAPTLSPFPSSMKGYELYSWQDGEQWRFALAVGTNRNKTAEEIKEASSGVVVASGQGTDTLLMTLQRLPEGEFLFWVGSRVPGFALPSQQIRDTIVEQCDRLGLKLTVIE